MRIQQSDCLIRLEQHWLHLIIWVGNVTSPAYFSSSCVPYMHVASFSGLSIFDIPKRLFTKKKIER